MDKLILIKIGGSLITDKSVVKKARPEVMRKLAVEIQSAMVETKGRIIVAHGAGSFAHQSAAKYKVNEGNMGKRQLEGLPVVASDAVELNRLLIKEFLELGLPAISFSPETMILSEDRKPKEVFTGSLEKALSLGYMPVLYGDIVFDSKIGFNIFSTEMVLGALANQLGKKFEISFIYCTDTDGVYDAGGLTIPSITKDNFEEIKSFISGTQKVDVTGGMIHKVAESLVNAEKGHVTSIINGNRDGELKRAILGEKINGTTISN